MVNENMKNLELKVKRKYRKYINGPLEYFFAHPKKYEGLSRWDLAQYDAGLYRTLLRHHKIEKAIPKIHTREGAGRKGLTQEEIQKIVDIYLSCDRNAPKAEKRLGYSTTTIKKYWKEAGLEILNRGRPGLFQEEIDEINNFYFPSDKNASKAEKKLGYSAGTILKYWREAGLKIRGRGRPRK